MKRARVEAKPPVATRIKHVVKVGKVVPASTEEEQQQCRGLDESLLINPPVEVEDDLFWLRDDSRENEDVLNHLKQENEYTEIQTQHLDPLTNQLFEELKSRMKESDSEVPRAKGSYLYYTRTEEGKSYPIHCRSKKIDTGTLNQGEEEVYLDENEIAGEHTMLDVKEVSVSPNELVVAYSVDFSGLEEYTINFKSLLSSDGGDGQKHVATTDEIKNTNGELVWDNDNETLFYLTMDKQKRPHRLWMHRMNSPQTSDICLYEEKDDRVWAHLSKSTSEDFVFLNLTCKTFAEIVAIPLTTRVTGVCIAAGAKRGVPLSVKVPPNDAGEEEMGGCEEKGGASTVVTTESAKGSSGEGRPLPYLLVVKPRSSDVLYSVAHYRRGNIHTCDDSSQGFSDLFVIETNEGKAENFKICISLISKPDHWVCILPASVSMYITGVDCFARFWAISGRQGGFETVWIAKLQNDNTAALGDQPLNTLTISLQQIQAKDEIYYLTGIEHHNVEYFANVFRFRYTSPTTPSRTNEYSIEDGLVTTLKQKEVPNVDLSLYKTVRLTVPIVEQSVLDGVTTDAIVLVPISLLYRPDKHTTRQTHTPEDGLQRCPFIEPAPCLLYSYGAYGISWDPEFTLSALSYCDRGVVYAIAHVRGGTTYNQENERNFRRLCK